jgi:hypothetical protein
MAKENNAVTPSWKLNEYMKRVTGLVDKEVQSGAFTVRYMEPFLMKVDDNVEVVYDGNALKVSIKKKNPSYDWM